MMTSARSDTSSAVQFYSSPLALTWCNLRFTFSVTLTTTAFVRISLRWFEASTCMDFGGPSSISN
ncbi:MAG: hypothetical protein KA961_08295 [Bacteroides sp.]|nr:hypothetical protein [Bacteroides sp.]